MLLKPDFWYTCLTETLAILALPEEQFEPILRVIAYLFFGMDQTL